MTARPFKIKTRSKNPKFPCMVCGKPTKDPTRLCFDHRIRKGGKK